ncbi:MAG: helix-turn-helix domain-containing protein [Acidobacteria bacterium]|nr:helix-turn-helix domain-containing protein [Acidobacteriota bacterium]
MTIKGKLEDVVNEMVAGGIAYKDAMEEFQKHFFLAVLKCTNGNLSKAAEALGVHRNTLSKQVGNYFQNGHMAGARLRRNRGRKAVGSSR